MRAVVITIMACAERKTHLDRVCIAEKVSDILRVRYRLIYPR